MYIIVEHNVDALHTKQWRFWFDADRCALVLQEYTESERQTTRHKFRVTSRYYHLDRRGSDTLTPPLPDDVADEAKQTLLAQLSVVI